MEDDNNIASKLMNDEIKEILNRLEKIGYYASVPKELAYMTTNITPQECKTILDYITNLQEKVKPYETGYINGVHDERERNKAEITNLQQELETRQYDINNLTYQLAMKKTELDEANDSITWWNNRFNAVQRDYEDYKSKTEKALLIIEKQKKKMYKSRNKIAMFILIKLDNILNGRSDE